MNVELNPSNQLISNTEHYSAFDVDVEVDLLAKPGKPKKNEAAHKLVDLETKKNKFLE